MKNLNEYILEGRYSNLDPVEAAYIALKTCYGIDSVYHPYSDPSGHGSYRNSTNYVQIKEWNYSDDDWQKNSKRYIKGDQKKIKIIPKKYAKTGERCWGVPRGSFVSESWMKDHKNKSGYDFIKVDLDDVKKAAIRCVKEGVDVYATYEYGSWRGITTVKSDNSSKPMTIWEIEDMWVTKL